MSSAATIPFIPDTAPFSPAQRQWLNGLLSGLFGGAAPDGTAGAAAQRGRLLILFGSQSGNAEGLAHDLSKELGSRGWQAPVRSMADHADLDLAEEKLLVIITSTWGEGEPPDNAVAFWQRLNAADAPALKHLQHAVLGLGDRNYLDFCAMGRLFDERLAALGSSALIPRGECDVDYEDTAAEWFTGLNLALDRITPPAEPDIPTSEAAAPARTESAWSRRNPFPSKLSARRRLTGEGSPKEVYHLEFNLAGSGLSYQPGDILGVRPANDPALVDAVVGALGIPADTAVEGDTTLREALLLERSITAVPPAFVAALAGRAGLDADRAAADPELRQRDLLDWLLAHPDIRWSADELLSLLGRLAPRLYSIASSQAVVGDAVHLCVAAVRYNLDSRARKGLCSGFLADDALVDGTVPVHLQASAHFKLPQDAARPVIMIGPGTGIAPFRAFLQERQAAAATGSNWLFFGNPHAATDFLYGDEISAWRKDGLLDRLDLAWSRDTADRTYVQHLMARHGADLWRWLTDDGAHLYVCGDAKRMAKDVDATLRAIAREEGAMDDDGASRWLADLAAAGRYQRDVY